MPDRLTYKKRNNELELGSNLGLPDYAVYVVHDPETFRATQNKRQALKIVNISPWRFNQSIYLMEIEIIHR